MCTPEVHPRSKLNKCPEEEEELKSLLGTLAVGRRQKDKQGREIKMNGYKDRLKGKLQQQQQTKRNNRERPSIPLFSVKAVTVAVLVLR